MFDNTKSDKMRSSKKHNYINVDANHYINVISDGTNYPAFQRGGQGLVNAGAALNSSGYIARNSHLQNTTQIDSCNTEATMLNSGKYLLISSDDGD